MTNQHTIIPPRELVRQWMYESNHNEQIIPQVADFAAQWGADQELEACCEWFQEFYNTESWVKHDLKHFRAARRPKPLSLKEKALKALKVLPTPEGQVTLDITDLNTIRRALETIND